MSPPQHLTRMEKRSDTLCVHLRRSRMDEMELDPLVNEILAAQEAGGFARVALSLGPDNPVLLYSVFLAKLVALDRILGERGCALLLCHVSPVLMSVFRATALDTRFHFVKDFDEAENAPV